MVYNEVPLHPGCNAADKFLSVLAFSLYFSVITLGNACVNSWSGLMISFLSPNFFFIIRIFYHI